MAFRGDRLRERRKKLSLSQAELAELVGTSQNQISLYELGKIEPLAGMLAGLAIALGTSMDYLMDLTDEGKRDFKTSDDDEINLLKEFRAKSEDRKKQVLDIIKVL